MSALAVTKSEGDEHRYRRGLNRYNNVQRFNNDNFGYKESYRPVQPGSHQWTLFRPPAYGSGTANGQFCANSYLGYQYPLQKAPSLCGISDGFAMMQGQTVLKQQSPTERYADIYTPAVISRLEKERMKDIGENDSRIKLIFWLIGLFFIVGAAAVVLVLATSTMHSVPLSSFRSTRQYSGKFLITEGSLLRFDGQLLQRTTDQYIVHSSKVQRGLDRIFQQSGLANIYAGSEVTQFRFVPAIPALDVSFVIRVRADVDADVSDLLSVLRSQIRARGFDGNSVDVNSISLENKRF